MSPILMSGGPVLRIWSPRDPLSLISLRQIVCSAASRVKHLLANALARACATILLCESEAIGCSTHSLPSPFGRGPLPCRFAGPS
jgi:hypothetical protein